ncbi:HAMP domain-containing sensor histidine kinase [Clostridium sp.]|uniref:HAMP domain-containing sensor histidine kinase n=1 Tax=Clostridium sp. TaxID=1506 RepID=UPI0039F50AEE
MKYSAMSQFSSDFFRNHFLAPGIVFFYGILASVFIEIIFLSRFYGRKISRKLIPLQDATKKIQNKDLEFEVQYSGILEIDETLSSIDRMKDELKKSLETQWKIEQARKMQISALAHDIKTPLTVIFGNGEMLNDTEQTEEQKEFTNYILKNAHQIEEYVQILIDLSKAEIGYSLQRQDVDMRTFLDELYSQINAIASLKQLKVEFEEKNLPDVINLDTSLMQRAIMNVVSNAVDYSKEGGSILVSISVENRKVRFIVYDNGKGFSMEALKNATKQFYQEDFSRSSKLHYGMGLYIADSIVKQHGGRLTVANSPVTGGGMVTLEF